MIAEVRKPARRQAFASTRYVCASFRLSRRSRRSPWLGRQPQLTIRGARRWAWTRMCSNSRCCGIRRCFFLAMVMLLDCDAAQAIVPQQNLERLAQRADRLGVWLRPECEREDRSLLRGGLGGAGGCHGDRGADRAPARTAGAEAWPVLAVRRDRGVERVFEPDAPDRLLQRGVVFRRAGSREIRGLAWRFLRCYQRARRCFPGRMGRSNKREAPPRPGRRLFHFRFGFAWGPECVGLGGRKA